MVSEDSTSLLKAMRGKQQEQISCDATSGSLQGDSLASESLDKDLHTAAQTQDQVKSWRATMSQRCFKELGAL